MSDNAISSIKDALQKDKRVIFAYLFGSRAKGVDSDGSDWDIAVYTPSESPLFKFYIEAELSHLLGTDDIQVFILNSLDNPLFGFEIVKHGILLIDRDEEKRIEFEARVLGQYHDWQYFLKRHMEAEGWL